MFFNVLFYFLLFIYCYFIYPLLPLSNLDINLYSLHFENIPHNLKRADDRQFTLEWLMFDLFLQLTKRKPDCFHCFKNSICLFSINIHTTPSSKERTSNLSFLLIFVIFLYLKTRFVTTSFSFIAWASYIIKST